MTATQTTLILYYPWLCPEAGAQFQRWVRQTDIWICSICHPTVPLSKHRRLQNERFLTAHKKVCTLFWRVLLKSTHSYALSAWFFPPFFFLFFFPERWQSTLFQIFHGRFLTKERNVFPRCRTFSSQSFEQFTCLRIQACPDSREKQRTVRVLRFVTFVLYSENIIVDTMVLQAFWTEYFHLSNVVIHQYTKDRLFVSNSRQAVLRSLELVTNLSFFKWELNLRRNFFVLSATGKIPSKTWVRPLNTSFPPKLTLSHQWWVILDRHNPSERKRNGLTERSIITSTLIRVKMTLTATSVYLWLKRPHIPGWRRHGQHFSLDPLWRGESKFSAKWQ